MKVRDLVEMLEAAYDDEDDVALQVDFQGYPKWSVLSYDVILRDGELDESTNPTLMMTVYGTDFDYPGILREVKDAVNAIPEDACAPPKQSN